MTSAIVGKTIYDPDAKIWHGIKKKSLFGPECSLGEELIKALMKDPEHIAQICYHNGKQYTNRQIATLSIRAAQHFEKLNIQQTDMIGVCASNSDYLAPLFFGAICSGLTVSTLDPSFDKDGIQHTFGITRPKLMFCDGKDYVKIKAAFEGIALECPIYTIKDHIQDVPEITEFLKETGNEANFKQSPLREGYLQTATVLCSSGTTGLPKGVCMSHACLLNKSIFDFNDGDTLVCFSTIYWLSGLICLLHGTLYGATRIISENPFKPEDFFDIIEKYKITVVFTPPSQVALSVASPRITDFDLTSLKTYFCGGSAVSPSLIEKIKVHMPNAVFIVGYGTSEVNGVVTLGDTASTGSTGKMAFNTEIKIVDDNGKSLGPTQNGEICMRNIYPWRGYYNNPKATSDICETDGWIHSGDIGYMDADGYLFIVDRLKDIFKYNNFHVSPTEIENVIYGLPDVTEACVCAINDIVSTCLPAAAIVRKSGSNLTENDVFEFVARHMAHFNQLRGGVYFIDQLPKTVSGKNLRREVTQICESLRNAKLAINNGSITS